MAPSFLNRFNTWIKDKYLRPLSEEQFQRDRRKILERTPVPVFWLFGKTGSGKTSIIKYLTKAETARIGSGFRPETRLSSRYDFPWTDSPILQFLDTRGLGEVDYDPQEDIRSFGDQTHLVIVTARAMDHSLDSVVTPLRQIRKSRPDRPVVLALTCLHDAYPQQQHPVPDPFSNGQANASLPEGLRRSIAAQEQRFVGLVDRVVPIDLTPPEDGFNDPDFGGDRLKHALMELLPTAYRETFIAIEDVMDSLRDLHERRAMPYVVSASLMAASAAAVPLPWVDIPAVAGIQTELIRRLAALYGYGFDLQQFLNMTGAVGTRLAMRQAVREVLKFVPGVGHAANAALAFGSTYALGRACCWYYGERLAGHAPTKEEVQNVLNEQLQVARQLWTQRQRETEKP